MLHISYVRYLYHRCYTLDVRKRRLIYLDSFSLHLSSECLMTIPAKKNMQELDLDKMKNRFRRVLHGRSITVYSVKREKLTLRYFLPISHTVSEYIYEYQYAAVHL